MKRSWIKRGKTELKRTPFSSRTERVRVPGTARQTVRLKRASLRTKAESPELKAWKKAVRERDNNTCRWPECGATENIHCHHIHTRKQRPDLIHEVSNGACLCFHHHDYLHHTVAGRQRARELGLLGVETYEAANSLRNVA